MGKIGTVAGCALNFPEVGNVFQDSKMALPLEVGPMCPNGVQSFVSKSPVFHRQGAGKI